MTTGTFDYSTTVGEDGIEFTIRVTYSRSAGFAGDRIDPPHPPEYEWTKAEIDLLPSYKPGPEYRQRRFLDVSMSTEIGEFLDAEMESERLIDAMAEDWANNGGDGPDPDDAYDAARDRRIFGDGA